MGRSALKSVTKNTISLSAAQIASTLFTMAFTVYAARVLLVEGFGKYALVMSYFNLFLSLAGTGLAIMLTREIAKRVEWTSHYLSTAFVLVSVLVAGFAALSVLLGKLFHYAPDTETAMYLAVVALLPAGACDLLEAAFIGFEHAEYVTYGTILENVLRTTLSLIALFTGQGLLVLFLILILSRTAMITFYLLAMNRRVARVHWHFDGAFFIQLVRDWRVFAAENWLSTLFLSLGVVILSFFYSERAVGPYAAADRTVSPLGLFAGSYTNAIFPYLSRSWGESPPHFYRVAQQSIKYMLVLVLPGAIFFGLFSDVIIRLLYTNAYAESVPILRVLIWVLVLRFTNPFLSFTLFASGRQTKSLTVAAITFGVYLAAALWMIPMWGAVGAAFSLLTGMLTAFCLYFYFVFGAERPRQVLSSLARIGLSAAVIGLFGVALRSADLPLPLLIGFTVVLALGLYVLLLLALRVPSADDLEMLRRVAVQAWQRFGARGAKTAEETVPPSPMS
jgi:O-antigen/teichoic acid export membrane protein